MEDKKLQLVVRTPTKTALDASVDFVVLRTSQGDMGILAGHEPCSVLLSHGVLRAYQEKKIIHELAVLEGFATVENDQIVVLSTVAEHPEKLEEAIASIEKERAENKLYEQTADLEMRRMETALRNSLVRMDISSYSIIKGKQEKKER